MTGQWFFVTIPTIDHEKELQTTIKLNQNSLPRVKPSPPKPPGRKKKENEEPSKKHVILKPGDRSSLIESEERNGFTNTSFTTDETPTVSVEHEEEFHEVTLRPQGKRRFTNITKEKNADKSKSRIENADDKPMEQVLEEVLEKVKIYGAVWNRAKDFNYWQVCFNVSSGKKSDWVLRVLNSNGISRRAGSSVSILPCSIFYKNPPDDDKDVEELIDEEEKVQRSKWDIKRSQFLKTVRARLTVAQIVDGVRKNATLTFDFLVLIVLASMIAALGLAENSSVILVASMLISPLMGPILAGTFGTVIDDLKLRRQGIKNELIGLGICIICGMIFGLLFGAAGDHWGVNYTWPTDEMAARGRTRSLWVGVLIALPSGAGVALSVLGGNAGSLVGVAISASLLPPAVNAGLLWSLSLVKVWTGVTSPDPNYIISYSSNMAIESAILGIVSLTLTLLNILCIFITGVLVLKIKEVTPRTSISSMQRFWNHDLRIVREYNKASVVGHEQKVLEDLAALANKEDPLGAQHEVRSFVENLREDPTFRNVRAYSMYPTHEALLPRTFATWHVDLSDTQQNILLFPNWTSNVNSLFSENSYYSVSDSTYSSSEKTDSVIQSKDTDEKT